MKMIKWIIRASGGRGGEGMREGAESRSSWRTESYAYTDGVVPVRGRSRTIWRTESFTGLNDFQPFPPTIMPKTLELYTAHKQGPHSTFMEQGPLRIS